jgi:cytochrome c oxidase cbb3-type subunit 3
MPVKSRGALLFFIVFQGALAAQSADVVETGHNLFLQKCAFCHGRDAGGGETGPDLTSSDVVKSDVNGNNISPVIRNGRPEKGMPPFPLSDDDIAALVAFVHNQAKLAASQVGGRRGVAPSDLQSGNADEGKRYFSGAGGCSSCHSPSGDLSHIAVKYQPLKLELRMLYPEDAKPTATVTLPSGETVNGKVAYQDEFTIAVRDTSGAYRSWSVDRVKYKIDAPAEAHWKLLSQYSDDDIHNLMAYLQTLR